MCDLLSITRHFFPDFVTSWANTEPKNLYSNGLQREKFNYAIKLIEENTEVIHLKSNKDYRMLKFGNVIKYHYPNNKQTDLNMQQY